MLLFTESQLKKCHIAATDGEIGALAEVYFDDQDWLVRYLVVDTGGWLTGRRVLIAPAMADQPDWERKLLPVRMTREKIEKSPPTDFDRPIDETHQEELALYYGWPGYWGLGMPTAVPYAYLPMGAPSAVAMTASEAAAEAEGANAQAEEVRTAKELTRNTRLRSSRAVRGYGISTKLEAFGHVVDFVYDVASWHVRYFVIDPRNWWPGKHVLIPPTLVKTVDWVDERLHVRVTREQIAGAPRFEEGRPLTPQDEINIYEYYAQLAA
jgi:uncharacterized protein YrrD